MSSSDSSSDWCSSDLCCPESQFRSSGHADVHGRYRRSPVERLSCPQPGQSEVAESRPLRRVERARLDAALRAAASERLRLADRGAEEFPLAQVEDAGASGEFRYRRSEEHTSELQSLMRTSYAVFCLKK